MTEETSIIHDCYIPPKRLIHLFFFMLISLKCFHMEDPYKKRCWTTIEGVRYHPTTATRLRGIDECRSYCEFLRHCRLVVFRVGSCSYNELEHSSRTILHGSNIDFSSVVNDSNFQTHTLDLICHKNGKSCWIVKGDYNFRGLHLKSNPKMTLSTCMDICKHEYPDCDVINYRELPGGTIDCYVKTQAGPLDKFFPMLGITSYILNRTCIDMLTSTVSTPSIITTEAPQPNRKGLLRSFVNKYYLFILVAVGGLLIFASTGCGINACKVRSAPPTLATVASPAEPA